MTRGRMILRQWAILSALQGTRFGLTLDELCEVVDDGVSIRTVYRDLRHLAEAGFPLHSENRRWRLAASRSEVPAMPLSAKEILALRFAEQLLRPLMSTEMGVHLPRLRRRLEAGVGRHVRTGLQDLRHIHVATVFAPRKETGDSDVLKCIESAILTENVLAFRYPTGSDEAGGVVAEPYSIWYFNGHLFLIAYCRSRCAPEVFALARIEGLEVLEEGFEADGTFDSNDFVAGLFAATTGPVYTFAVDFSPSATHHVTSRVFSATQRFSTLDSGWVRMTFRCAGLDDVATWVAGFGGDAIPVRPGQLVEQVLKKHTDGLKLVLDRW